MCAFCEKMRKLHTKLFKIVVFLACIFMPFQYAYFITTFMLTSATQVHKSPLKFIPSMNGARIDLFMLFELPKLLCIAAYLVWLRRKLLLLSTCRPMSPPWTCHNQACVRSARLIIVVYITIDCIFIQRKHNEFITNSVSFYTNMGLNAIKIIINVCRKIMNFAPYSWECERMRVAGLCV